MKWYTFSSIRAVATLGLAIGMLSVGIRPASAADMTAFQLIKEGNRFIGEQSKDRVVEIRSERSVGSLVPKIWYVVYYDETAKLKSVEVKMVGGTMVSVTRPLRLLEVASEKHKELERAKLKIDSDKALSTVLKESILENIKVNSTSFRLEHGENGPVWKIKLWAEKLKNPQKVVEIGEVVLDAETGKVARLDVKIERVQ